MADNRQKLVEALDAIKPKKKLTLIRDLLPHIEAQIDKGATIAQVAQALTSAGVHMTTAVLRTYLYLCRKKQPGRRTNAQGKPFESRAEPVPAEPQPPTDEGDAAPRLKGVWRRPETSAEELQGYRDVIRNKELAALEARTKQQIARRKAGAAPAGKKGDRQ